MKLIAIVIFLIGFAYLPNNSGNIIDYNLCFEPAFQRVRKILIDEKQLLSDMNNTLTEKDFERGRKLDKSKLAINYDALFSSNMSEVDDFKEPVLNTNIGNLSNKAGVWRKECLWINSNVPYIISTTFNMMSRSVIARAIEEFHRRTCIRFIKYYALHKDYVYFKENKGCWSHIGRIGGVQIISLGPPCITVGTIIHEMLHALGFIHEHNRPDRDHYVTINWKNIQPDRAHNFEIKTSQIVNTLGFPYDYSSVMHYPSNAFAIDRSQPTILSEESLGSEGFFSRWDLKKINKYYRCEKGRP